MTKLVPLVFALLAGGNAFAFDMLDVELGKPFLHDPGPVNEKLFVALPSESIKVPSSGSLAGIFTEFEIWVLSEDRRRTAFVMANRVFQDLDECEDTKSRLRDAIAAKLGSADFPYSETVESDPYDGTEYVFFCSSPGGSPYLLLNFIVRSAEMGAEFQRISREKLQKFNHRVE